MKRLPLCRLFHQGLWLCLGILLGGCYGYDVVSNRTTLDTQRYENNEGEVALYFGHSPQRSMRQISLLEVMGGGSSSDEELLDRLKRDAEAMGADAVVSVSKTYKLRRQGNAGLDLLGALSGTTTSTERPVAVFTGVAVEYVETPRGGSTRQERVKKEERENKERPEAQWATDGMGS